MNRDPQPPARSDLTPASGAAVVAPTPRDLGHFAALLARLLAKELAPLLNSRASVEPADVSPRRGTEGKEMESWREEQNPSECSDPTVTTDGGESSWSQWEARRLLRTMRARKRRGRSSGQ